MSEISVYDAVPTPKLADKLIGTSVGGVIEDITYNFTLQQLLQLFIPNIPANTLQGVLDYGNTATQNINLTGTISTTNLTVLATANILNSNLSGNTRVMAGLFDRTNASGTAGQVLRSTGTQVEWFTIPTVIPTLQQVLTSGNTADKNIILTANITAVTATAANVVSNTALSVNGVLRDGTAAAGGSNQILSSTGSGVRWVDLPVYNVISPLLYNTTTKTFSIQPANGSQNGYLSSADWINFDGKQDAIILTTSGTSGASTFVGNTLNIPVYTPDLSGYVPVSRTLTINGVTYNLSANRSWTIDAGVAEVTATAPLSSSGGAYPDISISQSNSSTDGYLSSVDWLDFNSKQDGLNGTGLVKSTAGTITYITDNSTNWNTAYNDSIVSAAVTGTATKTLTLNQQDGGTVTANWTDNGLTSVGVSMPSAFSLTNSPLTSNGTIAITGAGTTLQYVDGTGALQTFPGLTGFVPYTGATTNLDLGTHNLTATSLIKLGGTSSQFLKADGSVDSSAYITLGSLSASAPLSYNNATGAFSISQSNASTDGYLSSTDWNTFNNKQVAGNYITSLTGEATGTGPGATAVTLNNASVTGKVLTGVNITGGTVLATDTMLTAFGKLQNQINGLVGSTIYQGVWDASTNTPTLTSSVGTNGFYYIVNVAGNTNLNGITDWKIGDWAIFNGGVWQKVDNTESVTSVNGFTGAVSLTTDNIAQGTTNLYFANSLARTAVSLTTTGSSGAATYNNTTGVFNIPNYGTALANYLPLTGGTLTGGLFINPANAAVIGLDLASDTFRLRADSTNPFARQLTTTLGSGTLVKVQAAGFGGTYVTDLGFYTSSSSAVNTTPNLYLTGGDNRVGINTTTPAYTLDVVGTAGVSGALTANSFVKIGGTSVQFLMADGSVTIAPSLTGFVPYTGATTSVDLGNFDLSAARITATGGGGGGVVNIFKNGSRTVAGNGYISLFADNAAFGFLDWVSGNTRAAQFSLLSITNNTTVTLTIPNASGTIALTSDLSAYVPYTGATANVNLGTFDLTADVITGATGSFESSGSGNTLSINHSSGSGIALNITKAGNGEGLYINKTSGSGNAATIVGTLNATTLVKSGGTSAQFLKADGSVDSTAYGTGTVTSVAALTIGTTGTDLSSTVATGTTTPVITLNVPTASATNRGALSAADWTTFNNKTSNTGTVTSVGLSSATSGVTIGATPITTSGTITLAIATASGSQNGLLSSTDWTTFNNKQNALTNPVTGTGTTNYLPKFTGASTIGNSQIFDNGSAVGIGTDSPSAYLTIGQNTTGNNTVYSMSVLRGGSLASPGTYSTTPAILIQDISGDGPATQDLNGGLFRINASRIGDTDPNAVNATLLAINNDTGSAFHINGRRQIGINTTSPNTSLSIVGNHVIGQSILKIQSATAYASSGLSSIGFNDSDGTRRGIIYTSSDGLQLETSTAAPVLFNTNGATRMTLDANGNLIFNPSGSASKYININQGTVADGGFLFNRAGANRWQQSIISTDADAMSFYSYTAVSVVMQLRSNGNVLVGTQTDGGFKLDVNGTGRFTNNVTIVGQVFYPNTGNNLGLGIYASNQDRAITNFYQAQNFPTTNAYTRVFDILSSGDATGGGAIRFLTSAANTAPVATMYLSPAGNVGIGTVTLATGRRLTVAGSAQFTAGDNSGSSLNIVPAANGQDGCDINLSYYTGVDFGPLTFTLGGAVRLTLASTGAATFTSTIRSNATNGLALGSVSGYRRLQYDNSTTTFAFLRDDNGLANINAQAATFSSSVTANTLALTGGTGGINFTSSTTITNTASSGFTAIYANGGGVYLGGSASVNHLSIASGGAATFSSTISTGGATLNGTNVFGSTSATSGFRNTVSAAAANNTTVIPTWPFWDTSSQTMTRRVMSFVDGGNGGTTAAGTGTTSYIEIGEYYTGRGVIQMAGSGGSSPSDQGTGRGKDLLIMGGTSDNTNGYVGGRLFLQGGSGYLSSSYNTNFGAVVLQGQGGNVGIGTNSPAGKLEVIGDSRAYSFPMMTDGTFRGGLYAYRNIIGSGTDYGVTIFAEGGTNNGNIYLCSGGSATKAVTINTSQNVLIGGTNDNGGRLQVNGGTFRLQGTNANSRTVLYDNYSSGAVGMQMFNNSGVSVIDLNANVGNANFVGSVTASSFFEVSDKTLKTLITDNYQAKGIESVVAKLYTKNGKEELGYYAQDVQGILPSAVGKGADGLLSLSYREVHTAKISALERRVAELEQQLNLN